jgi:PII-like signaling protein
MLNDKFPQQGIYLKIYVHENRNHQHTLLYEWLLEQAKKLGIQGGSAFKAIAGYGRHGILHEDHFFELAGELPVIVTFITSDELADQFLNVITTTGLTLFYMRIPATFGVTSP